jgi:hypothetical protein
MTAVWSILGTQSNDICVLEPMVKQDITYVISFLSTEKRFTESQYASIFY